MREKNVLYRTLQVLQLNSTTRNLSDLLSNLDQRTDLLVQEMETTIQNRLFEVRKIIFKNHATFPFYLRNFAKCLPGPAADKPTDGGPQVRSHLDQEWNP